MDSEHDTPGSDKLLLWPLKQKTHTIHIIPNVQNHKSTLETLKKSGKVDFVD